MTAQPDSPFLRAALKLLLVVGVDEGLLEIIAPASVGGEGSGNNAAVELGGEVVVLGVLVLLGELGAVVVGGGGGVALFLSFFLSFFFFFALALLSLLSFGRLSLDASMLLRSGLLRRWLEWECSSALCARLFLSRIYII